MLTINFKLTPEKPAERLKLYEEFFGRQLQLLHHACCFYILEQCIQWTRVDTGRLRSGWTPFLVDMKHPYERSLGPVQKADADAVQEGQSAGRYKDDYLSLYVENGVEYAPDVDNALRGPNGGMFDISGKHSYRPAPVATLMAAVPNFYDTYSEKMKKLFENCDKQLEIIMKGGGPEDIEVPTDLGPPDMN